MQKKETHLEVFKNALTSTVKSISEKKNCEITFGKPTTNVSNDKVINLPEIDKLEDIKDYSIFRAMADSEALRLKNSNSDIYNKYKPGGEISQKLYKIAEKKNLTVSLSGDGKQYGLQYEKFIPILVKAIKDQDAIITSLTARVTALES